VLSYVGTRAKQSSLFLGLLVSLSGLIYVRATSLPQESLNFNACSRLFLPGSGFLLSYVLLSRFDGSVWNNGSSPPAVALAASRPTASGESLVRDTAFEGWGYQHHWVEWWDWCL
jgi:hypothetical protein